MTSTNASAHIALTPAGAAYAEAHAFRPVGCPPGIDAAVWRQAVEGRIETLLDMVAALMASLDQMDPDADREPSMGWAWSEPVDGYAPSSGVFDMCEAEDDKCVCDDNHDGELDMGELDTSDNEYSLGWPIMTESTCQGIGWTCKGHHTGDLEQDIVPA